MSERKEKEESADKIIVAALRLFAKKGYKNTSLEEVAKMVGFTKGAIYYHFKSKELLLLRVLQDIQKRSIDETIAVVNASTGTPTEQLRSFVKRQANWAAQFPDDLAIVMLMSIESANHKSMIRTQILSFYKKISALLERIIVAGKRTGEFTNDQKTADIVQYLIAIHDGNMLLWYRSGTRPDIGRMLTLASLAGFEHAAIGHMKLPHLDVRHRAARAEG